MEQKPEGRAIGGKARAAKMTPEERKASARKAALAKKALADIPKATHQGELKLGDISIQCAVLPDGRRVISERSAMGALGVVYGGNSSKYKDGADELPAFLAQKVLKPFIDNELEVLAKTPILYIGNGGVAHGLDATLLPKVCEVWLRAREADALQERQLPIAMRAEILIRGLAHIGIIALVDEATGYQRDREKDALAKILEAFVAKELQPWVKTFPADYYENIFRLYNLPYPPEGNKGWRPGFIGNLTNEVVYNRLAPELLPELKKAASKAERKAKLHQWLTNDIGHPKLREHLASIVTLLKLSKAPHQFMEMVNQIHPRMNSTIPLQLDNPNE